MSTYESKRIIFAIIEKKYKDYLFLYKMVNNGSLQGATTFEDFYWHYTYYSKYSTHLVGEGRGH
jgi:hypothetical protein